MIHILPFVFRKIVLIYLKTRNGTFNKLISSQIGMCDTYYLVLCIHWYTYMRRFGKKRMGKLME